MGTLGTIFTAAVTATIVIGGVVYIVKRIGSQVNDPNIIKKDKLSTQDVLNWIDEVLPLINIKSGCTYTVNVMPNSSTQQLLTKPVKNAYGIVLLEKQGEKVSYLRQRVFIAKELSNELQPLQDNKIVEIPIEI